ncbi:DUF4139 domain-containing protein [bacterium]|nr:MAG: DUF4139 domain-containing protein [bacterium]RIK62786.1 MAG: hypothetical protein DCC64_09510 [Planctomycetota bacterium]
MPETFACTSAITRVTVYARGAIVTRRVELPPVLPAEPCTLTLTLPAQAQAGSLRTLVDGERGIAGLSSRIHWPQPAPGPSRADELGALRAEEQRLDVALERASHRRDHLAELALTQAILNRKSDTNVAGRMADALAVSALIHDLTCKLDQELSELNRRRAEVEGAIEALEARDTPMEQGQPRRVVDIALCAGPAHLRSLEVSYAVMAARWWPAYSARIFDQGRRAEFGLEAFVSQNTQEDWSGVLVSLCTADMIQDIRLPELPSLRLGRAQPARRKGYRLPPEGLESMFAGFDAAFAGALSDGALSPKPPPRSAPAKKGDIHERQKLLKDEYEGADYDAEEPAPQADMLASKVAEMPMQAANFSPVAAAPMTMRGAPGGGAPVGGVAPMEPPAPPPPPETSEQWLDFDALTLGDFTRRAGRGRLTPTTDGASADQAELHGPATSAARDVRETRGLFDHQYVAEGKVEIPSGGVAQRVFLAARETSCSMRFVCVAAEDDRVYREVELANPLQAPLLPGPVDVFVEGLLLTTTAIDGVDRGGRFRVGLGVEERLRVARNVRASEESRGMLGGNTAVQHQVSVDVTSSLGADVSVEVIERLPVTADKDISVSLTRAEPKPEDYDQKSRGAPVRGGKLFRLAVKASSKASLLMEYSIVLPSGSELTGGNRRE